MRKPTLFVLLLLTGLYLSSCISRKQYVYFQNLKATKDTVATAMNDSMINSVIIQPNDLLDIRIKSTEKALEDMTGSQSSGSNTGGGSSQGATAGYLVDVKGNVTLPLVGEIALKGLTVKQAKAKITLSMKKFLNVPYVEIRFLTFKVIMLGEITRTGIIYITNEKATLIEAIAQSSDLTDLGNRSKVKVIRGDPRNPLVYEIDLTNSKTFNSAGFILQPNDIVYVEPYERKFLFANLSELQPFVVLLNTLFLVIELVTLLTAH